MRSLIATALMTLLLTACGQTGPLYLPKEELPKQELPEKELPKEEAAPAPAADAAQVEAK